jgi:hypothetical protein
MNVILSWLTIASACAAISACADLKPTPKPTEKPQAKPQAPRLIGRIASIPADKRFVLIQSYGKWRVETGTILTTRGPDERSANLLTTGESLGEFAAADLQSGLVEVGDAVYSLHIPQRTPPDPTADETNPTTPTTDNIQKNNESNLVPISPNPEIPQ